MIIKPHSLRMRENLMISWGWRNTKRLQETREKETISHYLSRGKTIFQCGYKPGSETKIIKPRGRQMIGQPQGCLSTAVLYGI